MKTKFAALCFLCFFFLYSHAQECTRDNYEAVTGKAQKEYNSKNYKNARKYFKEAFSLDIFPAGNDLKTALSTAVLLKDKEWEYSLCCSLAKGGIPLHYFHKFRKEKWYEKFKTDFVSYSKHYDENFNPELRQKLLEVRQHDEKHNSLLHSLREGNKEITYNELVTSANKLINNFKVLCDTYGFPTEEKMGYYFFKNKISDYPTGVLLIHIYQNGVLLYHDNLHTLYCEGAINGRYKEILSHIQGFGNSTGVEQEIYARFKKYRKNFNDTPQD